MREPPMLENDVLSNLRDTLRRRRTKKRFRAWATSGAPEAAERDRGREPSAGRTLERAKTAER